MDNQESKIASANNSLVIDLGQLSFEFYRTLMKIVHTISDFSDKPLPKGIHCLNLEGVLGDMSLYEALKYIQSLIYDDNFCEGFWDQHHVFYNMSSHRQHLKSYWEAVITGGIKTF